MAETPSLGLSMGRDSSIDGARRECDGFASHDRLGLFRVIMLIVQERGGSVKRERGNAFIREMGLLHRSLRVRLYVLPVPRKKDKVKIHYLEYSVCRFASEYSNTTYAIMLMPLVQVMLSPFHSGTQPLLLSQSMIYKNPIAPPFNDSKNIELHPHPQNSSLSSLTPPSSKPSPDLLPKENPYLVPVDLKHTIHFLLRRSD